MTTNLTPTAIGLIAEVAACNERGEYPAKIRIVTFDGRNNARTRSDRYKLIDRLIRDGYLRDTRPAAWAYALQVTPLGRSVI
jgi:hypothetical protein